MSDLARVLLAWLRAHRAAWHSGHPAMAEEAGLLYRRLIGVTVSEGASSADIFRCGALGATSELRWERRARR